MQVDKDVVNDSALSRNDTSSMSCRNGSLVNQSVTSGNKVDRLDVFEDKVLETLDLTEQFIDYLVRHGVLAQSDADGFVKAANASKSDVLRQNRAFLGVLKSRLQAAQNGTESKQADGEPGKSISRQTSRRQDDGSDASASASGYALFINALRYSGQLGLANLLDNEKRIESQFTRLLQTNAQPSANTNGGADKQRYNGQVSLILQVSAICVNTVEYSSWKLLDTNKDGCAKTDSAVTDTSANLNGGSQAGTSWIHFSESASKTDSVSTTGVKDLKTDGNALIVTKPDKGKKRGSKDKCNNRKRKVSFWRRLFCGCCSSGQQLDEQHGCPQSLDDTMLPSNGEPPKAPTAAEVARARAAALLNEKSVEYYHLLCETYHTVLLRYFEQSLKVLVLRIAALPTRCALQVTLIFTQRATLEQFESLFTSGALQTALEKRLLLETNACAALKLRALRFTLELDRSEYNEALVELAD